MLEMPKRFVVSTLAVMGLLLLGLGLRAQDDKWNNGMVPGMFPAAGKTPDPAPKRDLSGMWAAQGGVGAKGAREYPDDPAHAGRDVPYTAAGKAARAKNKPGEGEQQYPAAELNDPVDFCDPQGVPRMLLYELRIIQFAPAPNSMLFMTEYWDNWRKIWTDGRQLPRNAEPRWNGYSVGEWMDDYTFVVETTGLDERTWLDNVGRPHSDALRVEERWHRVDHDNLQLTVTIIDPKYYTQSWNAVDKLNLRLLPADFDMPEYLCSPSEVAAYNKEISSGHDNNSK
jgi:hypothetical protein